MTLESLASAVAVWSGDTPGQVTSPCAVLCIKRGGRTVTGEPGSSLLSSHQVLAGVSCSVCVWGGRLLHTCQLCR